MDDISALKERIEKLEQQNKELKAESMNLKTVLSEHEEADAELAISKQIPENETRKEEEQEEQESIPPDRFSNEKYLKNRQVFLDNHQ